MQKSNELNNASNYRPMTIVVIAFLLVQMFLMMNSSKNDESDLDDNINSTIMTKGYMEFLPFFLVVEQGCSGSTAISKFIREIITAHGLQRFNVGSEFLNVKRKKYKNKIYSELVNKSEYANSTREEILLASVEIAKKEAEGQGQLFFFKAQVKYAEGEFRERLDEIGVTYAGVYRDNVLDRCICATRDCFADSAGYPVFASNGTRTDLCFARRKFEVPILAHLENPELEHCLTKSLSQAERIKWQDFPSVSQESLFEFEYTESDEAFDRSIMVWMKLLGPFLSHALDERIVRRTLKEYRGSRPPPKPHKELVSNYWNLVKEIKGTKWNKYLRKECN